MLNLTPPRHTPTLPIPAVRYAQIADIPRRRGELVESTPLPPANAPDLDSGSPGDHHEESNRVRERR